MEKKVRHSKFIIAQAIKSYGDRLGVACSFGKDSVVLAHLCKDLNPDIQFFSIMTPYKPEITRSYKELITKEWGLNVFTLEREEVEGVPMHQFNVEACCDYYKVDAMKHVIKELKLNAWVSGVRNTENPNREGFQEIESKDGLIKINPILDWTEAEVWLYHAIHKIPVHPMYAQGYRSLGCAPCSNAYTKLERGGRWEGTDKCGGECGIHTKSMV